MLKQKFDNVTVISNNKEVDESILVFAQNLAGCKAQKTIFKNWRQALAIASKCRKELFEEYANTDPVKNITIYADDETIVINSGAYYVWGHINDVIIEEANLSWNKWGGKPVRVYFRPGAIIAVQPYDKALCSIEDTLIMQVRDDGFCGDTILGERKYGLHQIEVVNKNILFKIKKQVEVEEE